MKIKTVLSIAAICLGAFSCSAPENKSSVDSNKELERANQQIHVLVDRMEGNERSPKTYYAETDSLETSRTGWWCSGFYPGSLLYLYEETGDMGLYNEALHRLTLLAKEQYNISTHDLGFMMFCSFGNANRLSPSQEYKDILIQSAKSLSTRFDPIVGCIRSWNSRPEDFLVIIDNMMNLELLFWAAQETGDQYFYDVAVKHADTTIKNHFRPDGSSFHVVNYDPITGAVQQRRTHQGYADDSAWSRGQAWGLYGYTLTYRFTKDEKYLKQAELIADYILNHPNLPEDKIPYWDFNAPNIPDALRDASAGAIISSALFELADYTSKAKSVVYKNNAVQMLKSLADNYQATLGTNGGFIIEHGVGHFMANGEVDVPLTYADYYYIEALKRAKSWKNW